MSGENKGSRPKGTASSKAGRRRERQREAERQARRKRYALLGGAAVVALAVALTLVLLNRSDGSSKDDLVAVPTFPTSPAVTAPSGAVPTTTPAIAKATSTVTPAATATVGTQQITATVEPVPGVVAGNADAPVHVIEWGDYQCPFCGAFARTYERQLFQEYVESGKITFEFRDYPFLDKRVSGTESHDAAEAARCADDQGKFWEYHLTLYNNQGKQENDGAFARKRLIAMAEQLGLDVARFTSCFDSDTYAAQVQASADAAHASGINSTPTFSVNGQLVVGAKWDALKQAIDAALANP